MKAVHVRRTSEVRRTCARRHCEGLHPEAISPLGASPLRMGDCFVASLLAKTGGEGCLVCVRVDPEVATRYTVTVLIQPFWIMPSQG